MKLRTPIVATLVLVAAAAFAFHLVQSRLSRASLLFGAHPEVISHLERSLEDQRRLALLDAENEPAYRARFAEVEATLHRLQILRHSRAAVIARQQGVLLVIFAVAIAGIGGGLAWRQTRRDTRLGRLQEALAELGRGQVGVVTGERGRDTIGRFAAMIEEASSAIAGDRQRLAMLENLAAWQEAARRHAHEMRTPLTTLQLLLERVCEELEQEATVDPAPLRPRMQRALHELERLRDFTGRFSSFARLPQPRLAEQDLTALLAELVETYGDAWPNLTLRLDGDQPVAAAFDRDLIRQVLVNLWQNSSAACGEAGGTVRAEVLAEGSGAAIRICDDGPGIPEAVQGRLFQPYVTTRSVGEGMGLGLAISKKILLDHGGDLSLESSSSSGTCFRLSLPGALA